MDNGAQTDDIFGALLPYVGQNCDHDWASRWTLVLGEVERRRELMGLASAVASVRDDLEARRL